MCLTKTGSCAASFGEHPTPEPFPLKPINLKGSFMILTKHLNDKRVTVLFQKEGAENPQFAKTRVGQTILWLVHSGEKGITSLEVSSWAFRLADYIHTLRHDYWLNIITIKEGHDGGHHGRYFLRDAVTILQINNQPLC